jgi:hypothetical protein
MRRDSLAFAAESPSARRHEKPPRFIAEAEGVLRRCLQQARTAVRIDYETLANTWFNDDGPLPLIDGSSHLAYDPKTGKVQTWNEREGVKPSEAKRDGYTVAYQEDKVLVPPYGKFATIDILFQIESLLEFLNGHVLAVSQLL